MSTVLMGAVHCPRNPVGRWVNLIPALARVPQITPAVCATFTLITVYRMCVYPSLRIELTRNPRCRLSYTRRTSANPLSRVQGQHSTLLFLAIMWALCAICTVGVHSEPRSTCLAARLAPPRCISLGADVLLPPLLAAAPYTAARALRGCALGVYGTHMVPAPAPAPITELLPAWTAPHVADLRRACEWDAGAVNAGPARVCQWWLWRGVDALREKEGASVREEKARPLCANCAGESTSAS
ncbi:hypothetical protein FB451DRAFT_1264647 [Mycena latifolia]|nr:hypothetical protein FB451DRAFT_1264647 [Mycena latifolia]